MAVPLRSGEHDDSWIGPPRRPGQSLEEFVLGVHENDTRAPCLDQAKRRLADPGFTDHRHSWRFPESLTETAAHKFLVVDQHDVHCADVIHRSPACAIRRCGHDNASEMPRNAVGMFVGTPWERRAVAVADNAAAVPARGTVRTTMGQGRRGKRRIVPFRR
ncbi:hypothetical protein GCM10012280_35160 [Wenjunlia tyrosinilytica]|uniref:Uncharacterized protein n=1 Tax=Wenjunlia tyrosinilytica TaxID=1544741 RepID=A0A917ZQV3_9ACTN|nr:hypothetical protein GCM10012280_35160 [Wenjunlia tyrosinilytica]